MAVRLTFEMVLSEKAIDAAQVYNINIPEFCCNALVNELISKQDIQRHISFGSTNKNDVLFLRRALLDTQEELSLARQELREVMLKSNSRAVMIQ